MKRLHWMVLSMVAVTAACDRGVGGGLVARAAGHDFTVAEATRLVAPEAALPNRPEVVMALADLWIDYTLLATAAAQDSSLRNIDLIPLIMQGEEVEMIGQLRDSVIQPDTAIAEDELRRRFAAQAPGASVRARHILLMPPEQATDEQRDSVRAAVADLLRRVRAGESFEALARQYSQDQASSVQGGDLGFFERGAMVAAFDSAAFALDAGQISDIVATPFGYHIIRVEEKETPGFEKLESQFRQQLQAERMMQAESLYVAGVEERARVEVAEGAAALTRTVAKNPLARMSGRTMRRDLVKYDGGALTVGEMRTFMQTREPGYRQQVDQATDQQIVDNLLKALSQRELLVEEARRVGIQPDQARQDSLVEVVRTSSVGAAQQLGLTGIARLEGESQNGAIERTVYALLESILRGELEVIPLGGIAFTLRQEFPAEMFETAVQKVVQEVDKVRGPGTGMPQEMPQEIPPGIP